MPKRSNNKRRNTTRRSTRVAPSPAELEQQRIGSLEQQYEEATTYARENSTDNIDYSKKFQEKAPHSFEFEILKHNKLVERKKEGLNKVYEGLCMVRMTQLFQHDKPEVMEECNKAIKEGESRIEELECFIKHSELMSKLFKFFIDPADGKPVRIEDVKAVLELLKVIKENIHKLLECVEVMVGYEYYTEKEYNDIAVMFRDEYQLWSDFVERVGLASQ